MILFHPSSIGSLMGAPKSIDPEFLKDKELAALYRKKAKTDEDKAILEPYWDKTLSEGAKNYIKGIVRNELFGYRTIVTTKVLDKGNMVEPDTIALYNSVYATRHVKNTERRANDWLTGECDIYVPGECTKDAKSSWSLDTFPLLSEDCHDSGYEWQGVAYGILWPDTCYHELFYGMVNTPEELIKWLTDDERAAHWVENHHPAHRITRIVYQKDEEKARKLEIKARIGQQYAAEIIDRFHAEHDGEALPSPAPSPAAPSWRDNFLTQQ